MSLNQNISDYLRKHGAGYYVVELKKGYKYDPHTRAIVKSQDKDTLGLWGLLVGKYDGTYHDKTLRMGLSAIKVEIPYDKVLIVKKRGNLRNQEQQTLETIAA